MGRKFSAIWRRNDGIRISAIRKDRLPYMLAYLFELLLYTVLLQYLPIERPLWGFYSANVAFVFHMAGSLVIMLLWNERFKKLIYISLALCFAGLVPCLFLPEGTAWLVCLLVMYTALGGVVTCTRCGFAFATNNSEKAIGLVGMFMVDRFIRILRNLLIFNNFLCIVLPLILFVCCAVCLLLYKEKDLVVLDKSSKKDAKGLYWALAYFIMYFLVDGELPVFAPESGHLTAGILGTYIGIAVFALILFVLKMNSYHAWNVFFVVTAVAFLTIAILPYADVSGIYYFSAGFTQMGWPLALYFLACAQKRFASYKLLKQSTIIYIIASPVSKYGTKILYQIFADNYDFARACYMILFILIFLMLLPYSYRYLFSNEWLSQMSKPDMEIISEAVEETDQFEKWNLTPRQKEVAVLLLAGKTRRQISGELALSESTVKLHTSELYKKLNINSRMELFSIFGVQGDNTEE